MKHTEYNEKLLFMNLSGNGDFIDLRAVGWVGEDANYRAGDIPEGYTLIEYIISGRAYIEGESTHSLCAGDIFVCQGKMKYVEEFSVYSDPYSSPYGPESDRIGYRCDPATPLKKYWMLIRGRFIDCMLTLYNVGMPFTIKNVPAAESLWKRLIDDISSYSFTRMELCHKLFDIFDISFSGNDEKESLDAPLVKQLRDVLDQYIEKPLKTGDLTKLFNMSGRQLERVFEKKYGETMFSYLRSRRFAAACEGLRRTDELVYRIAARYHLGGSSHFAKEFASRYNMTPQEYRERFRETVDMSLSEGIADKDPSDEV